MSEQAETRLPEKGDIIYLPEDCCDTGDYRGGKATVSKVEPWNDFEKILDQAGTNQTRTVTMVSVEELPGVQYCWEGIGPMQEELRRRHETGQRMTW